MADPVIIFKPIDSAEYLDGPMPISLKSLSREEAAAFDRQITERNLKAGMKLDVSTGIWYYP